MRHHEFRQLPLVESRAFGLRDALQCSRMGGSGEFLSGLRRPSIGHEVLGEARDVLQVRHLPRPQAGDGRRHQEAIGGIADGRFEQVGERQLAEALRQRHPGGDSARHCDGIPAFGRHRRLAVEPIERPALWRAARRIQAVELVAIPQNGKRITANAIARRFDNRERDCSGKRGVDGVAALVQHAQTGLRGEWLGRSHGIARQYRHALRRIRQVPAEVSRVRILLRH